MSQAGKYVILIVFAVALSAAIFGRWYHYQRTRRSFAYFGPTATALILRAKKVELLRLSDEPVDVGGGMRDVVSLEGKEYPVIQSRDISAARGLIHMRTGFLDDVNFNWDDAGDRGRRRWTRALRFSTGDLRATLAFDFRDGRVSLVGRDSSLAMAPITKPLREFLDEQLPASDTR